MCGGSRGQALLEVRFGSYHALAGAVLQAAPRSVRRRLCRTGIRRLVVASQRLALQRYSLLRLHVSHLGVALSERTGVMLRSLAPPATGTCALFTLLIVAN